MSPMDVSLILPQISRLDQISPYGSEQRAPRSPFQLGQLLQAQVMGAAGDGRFILDIDQQRFTAASSLPLTPGSRLELQVAATDPQLEFRVLADPVAQRIAGSLYLLPRLENFRPLLQSLAANESFLHSLPSESQQLLGEWLAAGETLARPGGDGGALHRLVLDLGLNHESVLALGQPEASRASVKQILLAAAQLPQLPQEQRETATALVQLIDLFQLLQLKLDAADLLFFPLPLPFLEHGYLLVDQDGQQGGRNEEDRQPRYSLLLRLGGLGNLRVDVASGSEGLVITFHCEDQDKARFMAGFREELMASLSTAVQGISFLTGAPDPVWQLLGASTAGTRQLVDMKA